MLSYQIFIFFSSCFFLADLYSALRDLPFPIVKVDKNLFSELLNPDLKRIATKKRLIEKSTSSRRAVTFNSKLLADYKWLMVGEHGGYCIYCKLFCRSQDLPRRKPGELTYKPYLSYSRVKLLADHAATSYHKAAVQRLATYRSVKEGRQVTVKQAIQKDRRSAKKEQRLLTVVKSIIWLAKQGLAFRSKADQHHRSTTRAPYVVSTDDQLMIPGKQATITT